MSMGFRIDLESYESELHRKFDEQRKREEKQREILNKIAQQTLRKQDDAHKSLVAELSKKKTQGLRYNDGKLKWSYVHFESLEPMVRVLMFGAQKYEPFNWQKGLKKEEVLESAMRHLTRMIDGEIDDKESGLPHVGHLMCNAMFYQYMVLRDENNEKSEKS